ncbi:peptidoglycan-binding protein [Parvularcula sp. IMCC14364]|uniref:peptidoglycan-binding protein n=1 Tax=Parvularcula sp. IMCC14364 TaxID=3067902 RepID=UPI0027428959|nr:peptidoglycan-binding protein [Parvularcula sp. IMCC14364]
MAKFYKIDDINQVDLSALIKMLPGAPMWNPFSTQARYIAAILRSYDTLKRYEINTPLRIAHFLGQGLIETGFLRYAEENLNYSARGLRATFPSRVTEEEAQRLARNPEAIANHVYARESLGNTSPGDGWKYRGRGFFQLTGKDNYRRYGEIAGIDLVSNPDIISKDLKISVQVAAAYFAHVNLGQYADQNNARAVSRGVNLGNPNSSRHAHGEEDRVAWTQRVLSLFESPDEILKDSVVEGESLPADPPPGLAPGAVGSEVKDIQEKLVQLGYPAGTPDGVFGRKTSQALILFQHDFGLEQTGVADDATVDALNEAVADDTRGNVDIYRDAQRDREVRREVGANDNMGAGGAIAGAGGAAGVANETGALDEIIEQGTEIYNDITGRVEDAAEDQEAGTQDPDSNQVDEPPVEEMPEDTQPDEPPLETPVEPDETDVTTTGTEVPAPMPQQETVEGAKDWTMIAIFAIVILIGLYIIFRARRRRQMAEDIYRNDF